MLARSFYIAMDNNSNNHNLSNSYPLSPQNHPAAQHQPPTLISNHLATANGVQSLLPQGMFGATQLSPRIALSNGLSQTHSLPSPPTPGQQRDRLTHFYSYRALNSPQSDPTNTVSHYSFDATTSYYHMTPDMDPTIKRLKRTHDGMIPGTSTDIINAIFRLEDQPGEAHLESAKGLPAKNMIAVQNGQHTLSTGVESDQEQDNEKGPKAIAVSNKTLPPWLKIKSTNKAKAFAAQYAPSSQHWLTADRLTQHTAGLVVKPQPEGGDRGIPATEDDEAAFAKDVYDAIVDFSHFYGSISSPAMKQLLAGGFDKDYIQERSMDVVAELKKYHTQGLMTTKHANPNVDTGKDIQVPDSEQNDTCEDRKAKILVALRLSKSIAADVLMHKESLASAIILAPGKKLKAKLMYKESNDGRALKHLQLKDKANTYNGKGGRGEGSIGDDGRFSSC
jgi:hypothetical protein